jgi:hypothetical protein
MAYKRTKCVCLSDSRYNGSDVYKDTIYVYVAPMHSGQYYSVYDTSKLGKNIIDSIYVHCSDFKKNFILITDEIEGVDILFNDIMDGKVSM